MLGDLLFGEADVRVLLLLLLSEFHLELLDRPVDLLDHLLGVGRVEVDHWLDGCVRVRVDQVNDPRIDLRGHRGDAQVFDPVFAGSARAEFVGH